MHSEKNQHASLARILLEALPLAVGAHDHDVAVGVLLDCAGRDHLVDEVLGGHRVGVGGFHVLHLRLQGVVLGELGLSVQSFSLDCFFLIGDLLRGAAPLAARLE